MGGAFGAMAGLMANTLDQGQRDAQERAMARMRASGMAEDTEEKQYNFAQTKKQDAAREKMLNDPSLPPEVKQWLSMGASPADVMKMQNQRKQGQVEALLLQLPDRATRQQLWSMMQQANPSLVTTSNVMKMLGIGEKPAKESDEDWFRRDPKGYIGYKMAGREPQRPREQVLTDDKGNAVIVNLDTGARRPLPDLFKTIPKPAKPSVPRKALTPAAMNAVTKEITDEWGLQPTEIKDVISGGRKRAFFTQRKKQILNGMGYDESGQPLADRAIVGTTDTGDPLVWKNP